MPKYENPIKGYLSCPVCDAPSSVHQCGEGQLIATGEPPKNTRNVGLLYYRCPQCGNSPISKRTSEFVESKKVDNVTELKPLEAAPVKVEVDNAEPLPVVEQSEEVTEVITENNDTKPLEAPPPQRTDYSTYKRIAAALFILLVLAFMLKKFVFNSKEQNGDRVAA